jgi:hypothetical protein
MTYITRPNRTIGPASRPGDPLPPGTPERAPDGGLRVAATGLPDDPLVAPPDAADIDLFEALGGDAGAQAAAADLGQRLRADAELSAVFGPLDDDQAAQIELGLVLLAVGGPVLSDTVSLLDPLRLSHPLQSSGAELGMDMARVRRLTEVLLEVLVANGMPEVGVDEVVGRLTIVIHEALDIASETS